MGKVEASKSENPLCTVVSVSQFSEFLGLTDRWVRDRIADGYVDRLDHGKVDAMPAAQGVRKYYTDLAEKNRHKRPETSVDEARVKLLELQIEEKENSLISYEDAYGVLCAVSGACYSVLQGAVTRFTRDPDDRERVQGLFDDLCREIAKKAGEAEAALKDEPALSVDEYGETE